MAEFNPSNQRDFVEQLAEEFLKRFRAGEQPTWQEYAAKYPDHAELIGELFPTLVAVEGLADGSELEGDTTQDYADAELAGAQIGPYKLLQQIGAGGMGIVYMAEQKEPIKRRVALKIINPGMDSRQFVARFEAERQALAMMDHPNIARIFDVGTMDDEGRPYYVMELVMGVPITKYCNERRLTPRERLALFVPICQAVQHAHQKGIIHRDLKPSNILVAEYDLKPVPKIIDFGLAKALHQQLTEKTLFTQFGQLVGTWEYMSPEQARLNQLDIDTRSDIYSLGVLLYELLTGCTPFDRKSLRSAAFDEILRIIRDEDPPRPSVRLSKSDTLPSVAANCSTEPKKLMTLVRSDLDVIVMKALEKDRSRRYATATAFADDVERFVNHEPVVARRPSPAYRLSKFIRRNRTGVAVAGILLLSLVAGVIGTSIQWFRANRLAASEESAREKAEGLNLALEGELLISRATRLAAQSEIVRDKRPILSLLLAREAVESTRRHDGFFLPVAHAALLNAHAAIAGRPIPGHETGVIAFAATLDGHWMATATADGTARVFDLLTNVIDPRHVLSGVSPDTTCMTLSQDGHWLATGSADGIVQLWNLVVDDPNNTVQEWQGHADLVHKIAVSPDGRWLITASMDSTAKLWKLDAEDAAGESVVLDHSDWVVALAVSPDSRSLYTVEATVGGKNTIYHWDLASDDPSSTARELETATYQEEIALSADGRLLALLPDKLEVWEVSPAGEKGPWVSVEVEYGEGKPIAISPDNRWLVAGHKQGPENAILLWDLAKPDPESSLIKLLGHIEYVSSFNFSAIGRWLITGSADNTTRLWDLRSKDPRQESIVFAGGHDSQILETVMSPDERWLITISSDSVRVWDLSRGQIESGQSGSVFPAPHIEEAFWFWRMIALSPDARWLATVDKQRVGRLWELARDGSVKRSYAHSSPENPVTALTLGPNNRWLAFGTSDGTVTLWDLAAGDPAASPRSLTEHSKAIESIAITPDGHWLMTASDTTIRLWNLRGSELDGSSYVLDTGFDERRHAGLIHLAANSRLSHWLVAYHQWEPTPPWLWDLTSPNPAASLRRLPGHTRQISVMAQSATGRWLATGGFDGIAQRWDLDANDPVASGKTLKIDEPTAVRSLAISSDGRTVFIGRWTFHPGSVYAGDLWQLDSSNPSRDEKISLPLDSAKAAGISPDDRWLVVGSEDQSIHVWDLKASDFRASHRILKGHRGDVGLIRFSADSRWLMTSDGFTTRLWDLNVDSLLDRARRVAGRELTDDERKQYGLVDGPLGN